MQPVGRGGGCKWNWSKHRGLGVDVSGNDQCIEGESGEREGHQFFFQVGVCGPDFQSVGLANWSWPLNMMKEGSCELKFSNLGLESINLGKTWGCTGQNFHFFPSKGDILNWLSSSFAWNKTLAKYERHGKGVFRVRGGLFVCCLFVCFIYSFFPFILNTHLLSIFC